MMATLPLILLQYSQHTKMTFSELSFGILAYRAPRYLWDWRKRIRRRRTRWGTVTRLSHLRRSSTWLWHYRPSVPGAQGGTYNRLVILKLHQISLIRAFPFPQYMNHSCQILVELPHWQLSLLSLVIHANGYLGINGLGGRKRLRHHSCSMK